MDVVNRDWQLTRTIISSLILAGIIGLVTLVLNMQTQASTDREEARVQSATIIAQIANIQANIADVPALREKITHIETIQTELLRRQAADDAFRDRMLGAREKQQ